MSSIDMPWFNQNAEEYADDERYPELPIRTHGCGLCAASAAIYALFGNVIRPSDLRRTLDARVGSSYLDSEGVYWPAFIKALETAFPAIATRQVIDTERALKVLEGGNVLLAGGQGRVFLTASGTLHPHGGHVICFYGITGDGRIRAMDSQICGGADVRYSQEDFSRFMEMVRNRTGRDAGSCYALSIRF